MDDLIGDLEAAGFGRGVGHDYRKAGDRRIAATRTLRVVLPDGKQATRRTARNYKLVVAVLTEDGWRPFGWALTVKGADKIVRNNLLDTYATDVKILPVIDDRS